jgi:hypothetical protein
MGGRSNIKEVKGLVSFVCNRQQRDNLFPLICQEEYIIMYKSIKKKSSM